MFWTLTRAGIAAAVILLVAEVSQRHPRAGALLLTLPIVSILAFLFGWQQHHDLPALSRLAKESLVLVPLGLPFFMPLAFARELGLGFYGALLAGIAFAAAPITAWLILGPPGP
ncbi:MAG: hypothetical protein U0836_24140 [Pirellulales bacterium]